MASSSLLWKKTDNIQALWCLPIFLPFWRGGVRDQLPSPRRRGKSQQRPRMDRTDGQAATIVGGVKALAGIVAAFEQHDDLRQ